MIFDFSSGFRILRFCLFFSYCGHKLADAKESKANVDICDCTAPFSVGVVTDNMPEAASAKVANRGFCLNYVQIPCGTATP